jgi:deaminated glutathione amidase
MLSELCVAAVQLTSTTDVRANMDRAVHWAGKAVSLGATFVTLPENYGFLGLERDKLAYAQTVEDGPFISPLREFCRHHGVFLLAGSIPERGPDSDHTYNTSVLIDREGSIAACYRKIHLFDVRLADGFSIRESDSVTPGKDLVEGDVYGWRVGLSVCYDLRFPELYRRMAGVDIFTVPAAFTLHTGKDHWDVLLRARAIENQAFVVASGQFGSHDAKRCSWGKSQVIDPWGVPLAVAPEREGIALAVLNKEDLAAVRKQVPCLEHRQLDL